MASGSSPLAENRFKHYHLEKWSAALAAGLLNPGQNEENIVHGDREWGQMLCQT